MIAGRFGNTIAGGNMIAGRFGNINKKSVIILLCLVLSQEKGYDPWSADEPLLAAQFGLTWDLRGPTTDDPRVQAGEKWKGQRMRQGSGRMSNSGGAKAFEKKVSALWKASKKSSMYSKFNRNGRQGTLSASHAHRLRRSGNMIAPHSSHHNP